MAKFEIVSSYKDKSINLPQRKTAYSAGYDFEAAEDIIVPSIKKLFDNAEDYNPPLTLTEMKELVKRTRTKPTLVPTGIKCKLEKDTYLELSARSSLPLNHWLILANGVGKL